MTFISPGTVWISAIGSASSTALWFLSQNPRPLVAADDGVERTVETHEQDGELEWLLPELERVILAAHAGDGALRHADHGRKCLVGQSQLGRGP